MKDIKQSNKWKDIPRSLIQRFNMIKMLVFPDLIYKFNIIQSEIPISCSKVYIEKQKTNITNIPLEENNKVRGLTPPDYKT